MLAPRRLDADAISAEKEKVLTPLDVQIKIEPVSDVEAEYSYEVFPKVHAASSAAEPTCKTAPGPEERTAAAAYPPGYAPADEAGPDLGARAGPAMKQDPLIMLNPSGHFLRYPNGEDKQIPVGPDEDFYYTRDLPLLGYHPDTGFVMEGPGDNCKRGTGTGTGCKAPATARARTRARAYLYYLLQLYSY